MADEEKNPTEETAETATEPDAGATPADVAEETDAAQEPAADDAAAEPTPEAAAEATPATESPVRASGPGEGAPGEPGGSSEGEAAPREKKTRSQRHIPRSQRRTRSKTKREAATPRKAIVRLPKPEGERGRRQERRGIVVSDKGDKTIVVKVDVIKLHPRYKKVEIGIAHV